MGDGDGSLVRALEAMGWRTHDGEPIARDPPFGLTVVVFRRRGGVAEYLLLHRAHQGAHYAGEWAWGPPAGARHPDEGLRDCARRELLEETGLALDVEPTRAGTDEWLVYAAETPADAPVRLSPEHDAYAWLELDEAVERCLPTLVADQLRAVAAG